MRCLVVGEFGSTMKSNASTAPSYEILRIRCRGSSVENWIAIAPARGLPHSGPRNEALIDVFWEAL